MSSIKKLKKRSLTSEMERNVRQMLKLIEEDGDSFARKAEMYYQKRPELISLVEGFYRGYRSLAERYEHVAGDYSALAERYEHVAGDSDNGFESASSWPSPSPRKMGSESTFSCPSPSPRKMGRRISNNRAPGFDVFLGSGGNICGETSSTLTDSDDEFDDASSSFSGFFGNASDNVVNKRVMELEMELKYVKEKLCKYEEDSDNVLEVKINAYEQEVRNLNEKLRLSEEEINKLKIEVGKYKSMESEFAHLDDGVELLVASNEEDTIKMEMEKIESLQMQIASLRFEASKSHESIQHLQDQLNLAHNDIVTWRTRFNSEKRENTRLKINLVDRDHEVRDLKVVLSDAEEKTFIEKAQLKTKVSKLSEQQTRLEEEIRKIQCEKIEMEETLKSEIEILKEDIEDRKNKVKDLNVSLDALRLERDNQIENMNMQLKKLEMEHMQMSAEMEETHRHVEELHSRAKELEEEIERQKIEILEGAEEKREAIRQLCFSLEHYRNGYNVLRQAFIGHKRFPVFGSLLHMQWLNVILYIK